MSAEQFSAPLTYMHFRSKCDSSRLFRIISGRECDKRIPVNDIYSAETLYALWIDVIKRIRLHSSEHFYKRSGWGLQTSPLHLSCLLH